MACFIVDDGLQHKAAVGATPTIRVIANVTTLVSARYNGADIPVDDDSTTITVVAGSKLLLLNLAGPKDTIEIVEDCGDGSTHHLFGYHDDFHPVVGFTVVGS